MPILETANFKPPTKTPEDIYGTIQWGETSCSFTFYRGETQFILKWKYEEREFEDTFTLEEKGIEWEELPLKNVLGAWIDLDWFSDEIAEKRDFIVSDDNANEQFNRDCRDREFWASR